MAKIIGIFSGKGGVGKTTTVVNLAAALKRLGKKVVIVDCNITTPHLGFFIGKFEYKHTLNDVLKGKTDIISAVHHNNGFMLVPASLELGDLAGIDTMKLKKSVEKINEIEDLDFVLLDAAPGLGREALPVLDASDEIIFVATPHAPVVNDIVRCSEIAKEFGEKKFNIVLNMVRSDDSEMKMENIEKITNISVVGKIPFDKNILTSLTLKQSVLDYKPYSISSVGFMMLASGLSGVEYKPQVKDIFYQMYDRVKTLVLPHNSIAPETAEEMLS